jgi:hypothetical protein
MKAIFTRYIPATNTKGSRIKAYDGENNQKTIAYDYSLSTEDFHAKAAIELSKKMNWKGELISGSFNNGYVFVFADSNRFKIK